VVYLAVRFSGGPLRFFDAFFNLEHSHDAVEDASGMGLGARLLCSAVAWGLLGMVCLCLAIWRLRPAYRSQLQNVGKKTKARPGAAERPPEGDALIQWRQQQIEGLAPLPALRWVPRWLGLATVFAIATLSSVSILSTHLMPGATLIDVPLHLSRLDLRSVASSFDPGVVPAFSMQGIAGMLLASLLV